MKAVWSVVATTLLLAIPAVCGAHEAERHDGVQSYTVTPGRPGLPDRTPIYEQPWTGDPEKFTFCIIGDKTGGGENNWPIFDRAVEEVNRLNPDFAIMVGDLIQGYTDDTLQVKAQWEEFRSHAGQFDVPFLMLPGNHDVNFDAGRGWWERYLGLTHYAFTYKNCLFIALNTSEMLHDPDRSLGDEQVEYIETALAGHADVRHTFILMHHPIWAREGSPEWNRIEEALGDRPRTVIAGHWHRLQHELRDDNRYIVHSATGAGMGPSEAKILGRFHHYSQVVVDGDDVSFSIIEPGANWPVDVAPMVIAERARDVIDIAPMAVEIDGEEISASLSASVANPFDDKPVTVTIRADVSSAPAWAGSPVSVTVTLQPGDEGDLALTFTGDAAHRLPTPKVSFSARFPEAELFGYSLGQFEPFRDESRCTIDTWQVMGPFDVGPFRTENLPEHPEWAFPRVFQVRAPDAGWADGITYEEAGRTHTWQELDADTAGVLHFNQLERKDYLLGYASAAVYSPVAQQVAARVRVDNFMEFFVNGEKVGQLYGSPRDFIIVPVELNEGWNEVLVKIVNNHGDWHLWFTMFDPQGNLRFAPNRPAR